jgi:hypothetical protein
MSDEKPEPKPKPEGYVFGRPTKYRAEMCQTVIDLMREGKSRTAVAATLMIPRETLYQWERAHPDFADALKMGDTLSQHWWERECQDSLHDQHFQTGAWTMNMKNRFRWTDRVEHSTDPDNPPTFVIKGA